MIADSSGSGDRVRALFVNPPYQNSRFSRASRSPAVPKSGTLYYPIWIAYAAANAEVQQDIVQQLGLTENEIRLFHEGIERPNLQLNVVDVWGDDEKLEQILKVREQYRDGVGSGIVYFTLIKTLSEFSRRLDQAGVPHLTYHGDLERRERRDAQNAFMEEPDQFVLATNAFGMGVEAAFAVT